MEITGLLMVIFVGLWAFTQGGETSTSRASSPLKLRGTKHFRGGDRRHLAGVLRDGRFRGLGQHGRGDQGPREDLPEGAVERLDDRGRGLHLVSIVAVALVPIGDLEASKTPLVEVVKAAAPGLPIEHDVPVHHDVRGVEHRADQHADGQPTDLRHGPSARAAAGAGHGAQTRRTPWVAILFTTTIAFGLIFYVSAFASD